jgi:hypothetical protein
MATNGTDTTRKKKHRAAGEGTLRFSESKSLWIGRLMVGTRLDGKPDIREVSSKSQKVCRERLDALKAQAASGTLASGELAGMTVSTLLDRWLAAVRNNRRAATYVRYQG